MKLSQFNLEIPDSLIASTPHEPRDEARMLVAHRDTGKIEHRLVKDMLDYLDEEDLVVFNDTRVLPARLLGRKEKTNAEIEVFLLRELNTRQKLWDVMVEPARKIRVGNKLFFGENDLTAEVVDNTTSRGRTIRFLFDGEGEELHALIHKLGLVPLPPYVLDLRLKELGIEDKESMLGEANRRAVKDDDARWYQTIFSKEARSVAAPTAGTHFTRELLKRLELKGIDQTFVTLHIGIGAFTNVEVEDLSKHRMISEYYTIENKAVEMVNAAKKAGKRVMAVGTSVMRTLESQVSASNMLNTGAEWTDKFIYPPYDFKIANTYFCNLHPARSTQLMMTAAFAGYEFTLECYEEAVKEKYRFHSYGDAMLVL